MMGPNQRAASGGLILCGPSLICYTEFVESGVLEHWEVV